MPKQDTESVPIKHSHSITSYKMSQNSVRSLLRSNCKLAHQMNLNAFTPYNCFMLSFFTVHFGATKSQRDETLHILWNIWSTEDLLSSCLISVVVFTHIYHTSLHLSQVWRIWRCVGLAEWWYWWTLTVDVATLSSSLPATYRACSLRPLFPTHLS